MHELAGTHPVNLRQERYDTLFRGELPYDPIPDGLDIGISGLRRMTNCAVKRSNALGQHLDDLPAMIGDILLEHDLAAMDEGEAIFAFINDKSSEQVGAIVTDIIAQWEIAHDRNKLGVLIEPKDSPSKWLVIETAAAVMQTISDGYFDINKNKGDSKTIATIIRSWGPRFAKQWFDGSIIRQWMEAEEIPDNEQREWLEVFTPSIKKRFAVHNINDPLAGLAKVKENLEVKLTDEAIAESLGWGVDEVREVFTTSTRKHFAVNNINDPLEAVQRWVQGKLKYDLKSSAAFAKKLARLRIS